MYWRTIRLIFPPDTKTYGAIPEFGEPSSKNPFTGIWIGDYANHGNEFIAFVEMEENFVLPHNALEALQDCEWFDHITDPSVQTIASASDRPQYKGGLLGVKLTGDRHVPRGEYTFIIPNLGLTLRVAQEKQFKDAIVVGGLGHIAHDGFHLGKHSF